nr:threonine/serine exporter family protein [Candidatus Eremiobacteraeota bacterium]
LSVPVATLAGLIVLIPGLTLTAALSELASQHLASGTARLSGALMTFLGIAFGVALGNHVAVAALGLPPHPATGSALLPAWAGAVALAVSPLCFTIIFRADAREAPWIVAVGVLGVFAGRFGAATLGPELGAFAGAFAIALASRLYARLRHRPAAVVLVPGLLLLVPGTIGFRGLTSLMDREVLAGVATAFSAIVTAVALVAGLLLAGVVAPERRP